MTLTTEILQKLFADFSDFVSAADNKPFTTFAASSFIDKTENYKYSVYDEARENLQNKYWKPENIGSGKIQQAVSSAINSTAMHNLETIVNNLVDWRKKVDFSKRPKSKSLETTLFNFYKSKIKDSDAFDQFISEGLSYQFIAYLFFIKDSKRFMPISQERFDKVFEQIGLPEFKTSGNASWDNYSTFNDIIKQVRNFLRSKDSETKLLDAHSFLWIIGNQMKQSRIDSPKISQPATENTTVETETIQSQQIPNSYLFAWNPEKWNWVDLESNIEELQNSGKTTLRWSCRSHKSIRIGDRAFLVKLSTDPRGIMASGYVVSEPFLTKHWSGEDKNIYHVLIDFEVILNPEKERVLTLDTLKTGNLKNQQWTPQGSGILIKPELVEELEAIWFDFLTNPNIRSNPFTDSVDTAETYTEGSASQITQTRYERNPYARKVCLDHFGYSCSVCDFNFASRYGKLGNNFIHVHHLTQVATIGKQYSVDPIKGLRPVCPNCHAMLHKNNPPLTIEELKSLIKSNPNE